MRILLLLPVFIVFAIQQVASAQNDCGNTSFYGPEGVVTSPNFPLPYPHNLSCTYSIDVGNNNSVLLKFLAFDLESRNYADICMHDWLTVTCSVTDDENLDFRKRYCGTTLPRTSLRFFNCPVITLKFFADYSVSGGGFAIQYTVIENFTDSVSDLDCGETAFTYSSGIIRLPRNPTEYSASVNCTYTISTNYSSRISVGFFYVELPQLLDSFEDCDRDNIMVGCVSNGETELNPIRSNTYCRHSVGLIPDHTNLIVFSNCHTLKISMRSSDYNYRGSYGLPFTVSALDEECGRTSFNGSTGIVTSAQFPLSYPHSLDCVYSIDVDRTKTVSLELLSFSLEGRFDRSGLGDCCCDWLMVSCLYDGSVPANRKYCGETTLPVTLSYSNCDSLILNLVTDSSVSSGGFQIRYTITSAGYTAPPTTDLPEEGCGNTSFTGSAGFITSPRFPLSYPNSLDCVYSIDVDKTKTVALYFPSFNLEGTSHSSYIDSCNYDWLMISCLTSGSVSENSHRNRKYCGEKTTPLILGYSNCDSLTLNFVTDSSVPRAGFQLRYIITSADEADCEISSFSGPNGIVTSPKYPIAYPHNMSCTYSIDVGRNSSILLKFTKFDLEMPNSEDYCTDWLMISCNETRKANPNYNKKYCGSFQWTTSLRFVDCPSLVLEFVSDSSISNTGFMIEYTVVENSNSTDDISELDCGATLFANSSGVISLPRNPTNYLAEVNCTYTISANPLSFILLDTYLSSSMQLLQSFQDCGRESLTIGCVSEGETDLNPNTTRVFCRGRTVYFFSPNSFIFSDCRSLKLSIRSTNYDYRDTFRIPFSVFRTSEICGNTSFSALYGVISSRLVTFHYRKSVNCVYTIDSGHANSVVLTLYRLSFEYMSSWNASCNSGWLTITCFVNGTSVAHPFADRKLCGVPTFTSIRFPACRSVLLNYSSEYISYSTGFSLRYTIGDYDPDCGNTSFSGPVGFITSPGFPLSYAHNLNCLYVIIGGQKKVVSLSFLSVQLEGISNTPLIDSCSHDWLTVSCLSDQTDTANISSSRRYCGMKTTPLKFTFPSCAVVVLNFRSDSSVTGGGFKVRYAVRDIDSLCGAPVYDRPSGVISFPSNTTDYVDNFDCNYVINATAPSSISLKIWSISLKSSVGTNCQSDWLLIVCINGQTALDHKVSHRSCDYLNSSTQLTFPSCAAAQVTHHRDFEATAGKTFRIEYTVSSYDDNVLTTELPTTPISATEPVTAKPSCSTGCKLSPDSTYCECLPDTSQTPAISVSTEIPVTQSAKCEVGCKMSADGNTCDCSTTHSGDAVANTQMSLSGQRGHAVGISLTVIFVVTGAICLGAFLLFRRHQKKNRSEILLQETEEQTHQLEMERDTAKAGSFFGAYRNQDEDTSKYLPLRPVSLSDRDEQHL